MKRVVLSRRMAWTVAVLMLAGVNLSRAAEPDESERAADLVTSALAAEVAGDTQARDERLYDARRQNAEFAPAHWHSGMIKIDGQWTTLPSAELKAKHDPLRESYREQRAKVDGSENSLAALARWCDRQGLPEQARAHWFHVLLINSNNQDALSALDLTWHDGSLLTSAEIAERDRQIEQVRQNRAAWETKAKAWRRGLTSNDEEQRRTAERELARVSDPAAIPALLDALSEDTKEDEDTIRLHVALTDVLSRMDDPVALEVLSSLAVDSPHEKVREAAVYGLKDRPWHEYVPGLLWKLQMPLELGVDIADDLSGVRNSYSLYREGPAGYDNETTRYSRRDTDGLRFRYMDFYQSVLRKKGYTYTRPARPAGVGSCGTPYPARPAQRITVPDQYDRFYTHTIGYEDPTYRLRRGYAYRQSKGDAAVAKSYVEQANSSAARYNQRVAGVLTATTGQEHDAFPRDWWNWWQTYLDENPDVRQTTLEQAGPMAAFWADRDPSAFGRGTLVCTRTGRRQIQEITPGDEVLSQDPASGELAYKVVLVAVPSAPQPMRRLGSDADALVTTAPGNFIWATGVGWRMARDLDEGTLVHGIEGSRPLVENAEGARHAAVRLVVADFHTYYVGAQGMLVHDATLPRAAGRPLPGLEADDIAAAEKPHTRIGKDVARN